MAGDSAGGQIAAVMAHHYKSTLDFQILIYPCVDNANHYPSWDEFKEECYFLTPQCMTGMFNYYIEEPEMATLPDVSPIFFDDFTNLPKSLLISAEMDLLNGGTQAYYEKILANNGSSEHHVVKGSIHGFFSFGLAMNNSFEEGTELIINFLSKL